MERGFCSFLFCVTVVILLPAVADQSHECTVLKLNLVKSWADKLGFELWHFGEYITRRKEVQNSFESAQLESRDGEKLVDQIAQDISNMMELKVSAVKRIMETAENVAVTLQLKDPTATVPPDFVFYNSKRIEPLGYTTTTFIPLDDDEPPPLPTRTIALTPDPHFGNIPVNVNVSSVHVPTNVYERAEDVIDAIRWSEKLDLIFVSNYKADPSLSWQYFGSSTGFMRHYPAMQWNSNPVDLYDCRTRGWYIEAATSSKDVVILVDNSGSMTGQRREIARHVVSNILDTLGNNDFVNIFTFNETYRKVVDCFDDMLVQATLANVREFKLRMEDIETTGIANFSAALNQAFQLLETYRNEKRGACCNQAIMLITDGVPYNYKEIFEKYNWNVDPPMPVRVFTYLIGREVADVREVKWMACANQGYYVHLSTLDEVREQVINYIPVMARPLVLQGDIHPVMWSPVYADITDPKMTDYKWELMENEEQKGYTQIKSAAEINEKYTKKKKMMEEQEAGDERLYKFMTTVSMPVFDRRENATRIANLLGVAGTDVPLEDIQALMMPFELGVNGYAFIVTNNGFILIHPDFRPVFQGILKPNYNSVDMSEVEFIDDQRGPRDFSADLLQFREAVLKQASGKKWMQTKYHFDSMKRVSRIRKQYYWKEIKNSSFTVVVVIPEPYGLQRLSLRPEDDIHRTRLKGNNVTNYFNKTSKWRIHPDWVYCHFLRESDRQKRNINSRKEEFLYFLDRMKMQGWHWPLKPRPPEYTCDRSLMQAIVFDGRVTNWFSEDNFNSKDERGNEIIHRFGITVAFVATHSGLTRWKTFALPDDVEGEERPQFGDLYPRATDEIWYKRAVEQHYMEDPSFVYSVEFNAGDKYLKNLEKDIVADTLSTPPTEMQDDEAIVEEDLDNQAATTEAPDELSSEIPLVTATHAVFLGVDPKSAPAAVVGFQFHHTSLHQLFTNITSSCGESVPCTKTCKDEYIDCYMVDNNGFIVVSEQIAQAGKFFGDVEQYVMTKLIKEGIFKKIHMTDYQAVCADPIKTKNPGNRPINPFFAIGNFLNWLGSLIFWIWQHGSLEFPTVSTYSYANDEVIYQSYESDIDSVGGDGVFKRSERAEDAILADKYVIINRTRLTPCDKTVFLYQLLQYRDKDKSPYKNGEDIHRPYIVQPISNSNMILVVVDKGCPEAESVASFSPIPTEVITNNTLACERANAEQLARRHLPRCIKYHQNESQIELCGDATHLLINWKISLVFPILVLLISHRMYNQIRHFAILVML